LDSNDFAVENPIDKWPTELIPKAIGKFVYLVQLEVKTPELFNVSDGGIILPSQGDNRKFGFHVYQIVGLGDDVGKSVIEADMNFRPELKIGQWVHVTSATEVVWLGKKYYTCFPQFITGILKEPEAATSELFEIWRKAKSVVPASPNNVVPIFTEKS